jgi:hypothetical protein
MTTRDEGIYAVSQLLVRGAVDPLPMTFPNMFPEEVSAYVKAVIDHCNDAGVRLASVQVREEIAADLREIAEEGGYEGVPILLAELVESDVVFSRELRGENDSFS